MEGSGGIYWVITGGRKDDLRNIAAVNRRFCHL